MPDIDTMQLSAEEEAAEEAAFESIITGTDVEAPAPSDGDQPQDEPPGEPDAGTPDDEQPPAEPELTVKDVLNLLEQQKAENAKLRDTIYGKIGNLQQKVDAAKTAATGISPKAKERLQADFPELAEMLFEEAEEPQGGYTPPVSYTPPATDLPDLDGLKLEFEKRLLKRDHPDWEQVVVSPDFKSWAQTLPPEVAAELDSSQDADYISGKLGEFKKYRAELQRKAEEDKKRKARLDNAVTPRGLPKDGTGYSVDDEETAMMEAYGSRSR